MNNKEDNGLINKLVDMYAPENSKDVFRQILSTVIKLGKDETVRKGDLKLINHAFKEFSTAFSIFSKYQTKRKVAIFGSARTKDNAPEYQMARKFSEEIVKLGFMVITGAGGGIMKAGNEGAGTDNSFGVNIKLPFEQIPNSFIRNDPKCITFKYFFARKLTFIKESDATVLFPGGFGTLDEAYESLTLFQTGKCRPRPIIMIEPEDSCFWDEWLHFFKKNLIGNSLVSEHDISLFSHHKRVEDAVQEIKDFYRVYNSMRYVGKNTILYLTKPVNNDIINEIKHRFSDILVDDKIELVLEEDGLDRENIWASIPYLSFRFNRKDFGRLNEMIRFINKSV